MMKETIKITVTSDQINEKFGVTFNKEFILKNVTCCLERRGGAKDYITGRYLDLDMYFRVRVNDEATLKLRKEHIECFGITCEELTDAVRRNTRAKTEITSLGSVLGVPCADSLMVMTNAERMYGAGALAFPEMLREFCNENGMDSCYILPSSIHEVLILPTDGMEKSHLDAMVRSVNEVEVAPEEQLADHAYLYNVATGKITY